MSEKELNEVLAVQSASWWARFGLTFNCSMKQWKEYCKIFDRDIEFFLS